MPRRPRSKVSVYHENTARAGSAVSSCLHAAANESSADEQSHHLADLDAAIDNAIKQSKDGLASLESLLKMKLEMIARKRPTTTSPKGRKKAPEPTLQLTSAVPKTLPLPLTSKELLSCGLSYAGFSIQRQGNVRLETNIERFKGFYIFLLLAFAPFFSFFICMFLLTIIIIGVRLSTFGAPLLAIGICSNYR